MDVVEAWPNVAKPYSGIIWIFAIIGAPNAETHSSSVSKTTYTSMISSLSSRAHRAELVVADCIVHVAT